MLRNLIFAWPGALALELRPATAATDLLFEPARNPELLLEEMRERFQLPFDVFDPFSEVDGRVIVRLRPYALEFLRFCRATRRRLFLLGVPQPDLAPFFEGTYSGTDKRTQIASTLAEHGLLAAETAFIDSMPRDFSTSVKTIAVGHDAREGQPDVIVRDLAELQSLLEIVPPNDEIRIEELAIYGRVGVPDEERAEPQRLVLSANLQPGHAFDELEDDLARTVDYAAACQELREFVRQRTDRLIETLADAMAEHLLGRFDLERVELELRKFVLPETRFVAVRLARSAPARA